MTGRARPMLQLVGDADAAFCDPEGGSCELPPHHQEK